MILTPGTLTPRWTKLRYHATQQDYWACEARYCVVPAGRRSGKSELAKRKLVLRAMTAHEWCQYPDPRFFAAAPTVSQVKRIWWDDLKALIPSYFVYGRVNESALEIRLINGARICLLGMDKPERCEGSPWDGGILDEYANMKDEAWGAHVRPALSDRLGWCDFIGVPEGRNHYYDLFKKAKALEVEAFKDGVESEWRTFHWKSKDILPRKEIEAAENDLDEVTFRQEYEGSFENYTGRCYWPFDDKTHCAPLAYDPKSDLIFCFDFNVDPGVAAVCQEQVLPNGIKGTGVIGEVYMPRGSNTVRVTNKLITMFEGHKGKIRCFGDATGGARGSAKIQGSDWHLIRSRLRGAFSSQYVIVETPKQNPRERDRVNSLNSRLKTMSGEIRLMVDPSLAPHVVKDFEGVCLLKGGSGEIDKHTSPALTHLTDAIGYYVHKKFPVKGRYIKSKSRYWK